MLQKCKQQEIIIIIIKKIIIIIFQAEVYATKACAVENLDRDYRNRNI
jgi:hypothetical protein